MYYYIDKNNNQRGPVLMDKLIVLGVTPDSFVWEEGMADWQQAKFVEKLNSIWNDSYYHSLCRACRLNDSAICGQYCRNNSEFSPLEQFRDIDFHQPQKDVQEENNSYEPISATGWLIAAYIFALLGGLLGIALGISVWKQKVELENGTKTYKYKKSHRKLGILASILASISAFIWKFVLT